MSVVVEETFEGTGYVSAGWAETVEAGCMCDEDFSQPLGGPRGTVCLRSVVQTPTYNDAYARLTLGANQNTAYVRFYFYLLSEGATTNQLCNVVTVRDTSNNFVAGVQFIDDSVTGKSLRFGAYRGSAVNYTGTKAISVQTWYRVEFKYDLSTNTYEWRVDGSTEAGGSLTPATRTPRKLDVGVNGSTATAGVEVVIDEVVWDNATWPGEAVARNVAVWPTQMWSDSMWNPNMWGDSGAAAGAVTGGAVWHAEMWGPQMWHPQMWSDTIGEAAEEGGGVTYFTSGAGGETLGGIAQKAIGFVVTPEGLLQLSSEAVRHLIFLLTGTGGLTLGGLVVPGLQGAQFGAMWNQDHWADGMWNPQMWAGLFIPAEPAPPTEFEPAWGFRSTTVVRL